MSTAAMGTAVVSIITAVSEFLSWVMVMALLQALLLEVIATVSGCCCVCNYCHE